MTPDSQTTPSSHSPSEGRRLLDEPLRKVSICRGPDGAYYLTGEDFENESGGGARLWRSPDLYEWTALGVVLKTENGRPARSPKLYHVGGGWRMVFSQEHTGVWLAGSASGRPEGPYGPAFRMTTEGDDPSLFEDGDGAVYLIHGAGWIARLRPDFTGLT